MMTIDIESELQRAIEAGEFVLYYQPQYNLTTSRFDGLEALIRWQHPERGLVLPSEFIEIAEQSDIISQIGDWALKTACLQFKAWQDKSLSPLRIAVNVSGRQFTQKNFVRSVIDFLKEIDLSPECLELELSENMIINENEQVVIKMIQELDQAGILIALDDFGTGHSNPEYLKHIPVDRIKIAKSHIDNILQDNDEARLVKSLIRFASELNLPVVAEGVETLLQLQMLLGRQHMEVQGNYFSEPLPVEQIEIFLTANRK